MPNFRRNLREQTTTGGAVVNSGGHVDLALGTFDRPGPNPNKKDSFKFNPKFNPVVPVEMVATQLATDRPPVEDDEYSPTSSQELSYAVAEISKDVPNDQIKNFYDKIKQFAQESIDEEETQELDVRGEQEMTENLKREAVKRYINKVLDQMISEQSNRDIGAILRSNPKKYWSDADTDDGFGEEESEEPGEISAPITLPPQMSWEDLGKSGALGYTAGISGARQALMPMTEKLLNMSKYLHDETVQKIAELQSSEVPALKDALLQKLATSKSKQSLAVAGYLKSMTENPDGSDNPRGMNDLGRYFISDRIIDPENEALVVEVNRAAVKWIKDKLPYIIPAGRSVEELSEGYAGLFDTLRRLLNGMTNFDAKKAPSRIFDFLIAENLTPEQQKDAIKKIYGGSTLGLRPEQLYDKQSVLARVSSLAVTPLQRAMRQIEEMREELNENILDRIDSYQSDSVESKIEDFQKTVETLMRKDAKASRMVKV